MHDDIAKQLEQTFEYSAIWVLEKLEYGEDTVARVPATLMEDTAVLAAKYPDAFERSLYALLLNQSRPATAAEFVERVNEDVRKQGAVAVRLE